MITYHEGDLLKSRCDIICHQVNCLGVMGAGIAKQIKEQYPENYKLYKYAVDSNKKEDCLGRVCYWTDFKGLVIANMFAQLDIYPRDVVHTDYKAFRECCKSIKDFAYSQCVSGLPHYRIGFPYNIGCGLAGGDWNIVSQILEEEFAGPHWNVEIWKYVPQESII